MLIIVNYAIVASLVNSSLARGSSSGQIAVNKSLIAEPYWQYLATPVNNPRPEQEQLAETDRNDQKRRINDINDIIDIIDEVGHIQACLEGSP